MQGVRELVMIAIERSRGESIILAPVTPTALHPSPIQVVKACLPHALHFSKGLSRLNANLGSIPQSSNIANSGKNIAIGGSITATTHNNTLSIPSISRLIIIGEMPNSLILSDKNSSKLKNADESISLG